MAEAVQCWSSATTTSYEEVVGNPYPVSVFHQPFLGVSISASMSQGLPEAT